MKDRIKDKINDIERYLEEFYNIFPLNIELEDYVKDLKIKAISERYFEKIIEAIIDLAFLVIKYKNLKIPEDDESSFFILSEYKIISENLAIKFKEAKGMRNIIVHEYGKINDELVYYAIKDELMTDVNEFINNVEDILKCQKK